jgi:hypothetical protein
MAHKQATDVDRALVTIGGVSMQYRTFGPLPIPKHNPELDQIFVYDDAGEGQYRPPVKPEPEQQPAIRLAGLPDPSAVAEQISAPLPAQQPPLFAASQPAPISALQSRLAQRPAEVADFGLPELWRQRRDVNSATSATGAEARSLAAMFNMLAGKTRGGSPNAQQNAEESVSKDDRGELFRRL